MDVVKIGTVDLEDGRGNRTPFGRVNITNSAGKKSWHYFRNFKEFNAFSKLWMELEKPWKRKTDFKGKWVKYDPPTKP